MTSSFSSLLCYIVRDTWRRKRRKKRRKKKGCWERVFGTCYSFVHLISSTVHVTPRDHPKVFLRRPLCFLEFSWNCRSVTTDIHYVKTLPIQHRVEFSKKNSWLVLPTKKILTFQVLKGKEMSANALHVCKFVNKEEVRRSDSHQNCQVLLFSLSLSLSLPLSLSHLLRIKKYNLYTKQTK